MADGADGLIATTVASIRDIDAHAWNALANPPNQPYNPFVSFAFLDALEQSKSIAPETGWAPAHLLLRDGGALVGAAPLYLKGHSQGEFVFDHHWADAYSRAGGRYYPKLLCAAPFTPANGPRLLCADKANLDTLALTLRQVAMRMGVSSAHVNFIDEDANDALSRNGFLPRMGEQFHWFNRDYRNFDDFLGAVSSRKRKTIRRERRVAKESGLIIKRLHGAEITERYWDAFWLFYQDTGSRKWGSPYLTRTFFRLVAGSMSNDLLMIIAERDGEPIAGALNFIGGDTLYGRYWGCTEYTAFLHFELCYYQAIDFAIDNRVARVEAGAQGEHKIARGYEPVATRSAHWIADENFRDAIAQYLDSERAHTGAEIDALKSFTPYKRSST